MSLRVLLFILILSGAMLENRTKIRNFLPGYSPSFLHFQTLAPKKWYFCIIEFESRPQSRGKPRLERDFARSKSFEKALGNS